MTTKHTLDLFDNAIDYLNEAVKYYLDARKYREVRLYKFCILHIVSFAELFFKYYVSLESELLIYEKPYEPIKDSSKTIIIERAIAILKNSKRHSIESIDINRLQKLRNDAMHHKIEYDPEYIDDAFGKLLYELISFDDDNDKIDIIKHCQKDYQENLKIIKDGYTTRLEQAKKKMDNKEIEAKKDCGRMKYQADLDFEKGLYCESCGNFTLVKHNGNFECTFCENKPIYKCQGRDCDEILSDYWSDYCDSCYGYYHAITEDD